MNNRERIGIIAFLNMIAFDLYIIKGPSHLKYWLTHCGTLHIHVHSPIVLFKLSSMKPCPFHQPLVIS